MLLPTGNFGFSLCKDGNDPQGIAGAAIMDPSQGKRFSGGCQEIADLGTLGLLRRHSLLLLLKTCLLSYLCAFSKLFQHRTVISVTTCAELRASAWMVCAAAIRKTPKVLSVRLGLLCLAVATRTSLLPIRTHFSFCLVWCVYVALSCGATVIDFSCIPTFTSNKVFCLKIGQTKLK